MIEKLSNNRFSRADFLYFTHACSDFLGCSLTVKNYWGLLTGDNIALLPLFCSPLHLTDPKEQKTQQSPAFGLVILLQDLQRCSITQ